MFPEPDHVKDRKARILALLRDGEISIKEICLRMGMSFPAELEKLRASLNWLELNKQVVKVVRPTGETRHAYYSLPNGERS